MTDRPPMDAEEVAASVADAISRGTKIIDVMVGLAAFLAAIVKKTYPEELRKAQIVNFANAAWEMIENNEVEIEGEAEEVPPTKVTMQ